MIKSPIKINLPTNLIWLAIGFMVCLVIYHPHPNQPGDNSVIIREDSGDYVFTNPLLDYEITGVNIELVNIKTPVEKFISQAKSENLVDFVSIYFRDLKNGYWTGISPEEKFRPASLLKVPLMMAYFKMAEANPEILIKRLTFESDFAEARQYNSVVPPSHQLEIGKSYTIIDLIDHAIVYSDNQSTGLLMENVDPKNLHEAYTRLHIDDAMSPSNDGMVTIKQYAGFFRILYNSSYLNRYYSELSLTKLNQSEYKDGLVAGVPSNVPVAHKFGESSGSAGQNQFHDIGIIYHQTKPYILAVMTRGEDPQKLQSVIAQISKIVYDSVDKQT